MPVTQWTDGKLIAILRCYRFNHEARDCLDNWPGQERLASQHDFVTLREEGLAFKRELARFHELTGIGKAYASSAAKLVAQKLGLHHIAPSGHGSASCSCGWRRSYDRKYGGETSGIQNAIGRHLVAVKNGTWTPESNRIDPLAHLFGDQA